MKKKLITFVVGFIIYGLIFGGLIYFTETEKNLVVAIKEALFFGIGMGLFETFVNPAIKRYFSKKNKE